MRHIKFFWFFSAYQSCVYTILKSIKYAIALYLKKITRHVLQLKNAKYDSQQVACKAGERITIALQFVRKKKERKKYLVKHNKLSPIK